MLQAIFANGLGYSARFRRFFAFPMKNLLFSGAAMLALTLSFTACKKEKADPPPVAPVAPVAPVPAPILTGLSPTSGLVGSTVAITGTNLTGTAVVTFNGTTSTYTVNGATSITATVPAGATPGPVTVTTPSGTSNGLTFTPLTRAQTLSSGPWYQTAATVNPPLDVNGTGTLVTDLFATYPTCFQDNPFYFDASGAFHEEPGTVICPGRDQTYYPFGTWALNAGQTNIILRIQGVQRLHALLELSATRLQFTDTISGQQVSDIHVVTRTFAK